MPIRNWPDSGVDGILSAATLVTPLSDEPPPQPAAVAPRTSAATTPTTALNCLDIRFSSVFSVIW
jgi:hypothetical protein